MLYLRRIPPGFRFLCIIPAPDISQQKQQYLVNVKQINARFVLNFLSTFGLSMPYTDFHTKIRSFSAASVKDGIRHMEKGDRVYAVLCPPYKESLFRIEDRKCVLIANSALTH